MNHLYIMQVAKGERKCYVNLTSKKMIGGEQWQLVSLRTNVDYHSCQNTYKVQNPTLR